MEQLSTKINNLSVSYLSKSSAKSKVSVVFIHGFPFNKTTWNEQLKVLGDTVTGIAYDVRGFGESISEHSFFSIDLFAKDLLALIDKLNLANCVLCGLSMGGYIALRAFELNPEKIKGLVLCDTNCVADSNEGKIKRFASIDQLLDGKKGDFTEGFIQNVFSENTLSNKPDVVQFLREVIKSTSDATICSTQMAMASRTDTSAALQKINVPTLIIRGENDKLMSAEQTQQLVNGIKQSELVNISKAGHLPNLENPVEFNTTLSTFFNKHFHA